MMKIGDVKRLCAEFYGMSREEMTGSTRRHDIAHKRYVAMMMCREFCAASYPKIGNAFDRDHSVALTGIRMAAAWEAADNDMALEVALLRAQLSLGAISYRAEPWRWSQLDANYLPDRLRVNHDAYAVALSNSNPPVGLRPHPSLKAGGDTSGPRSASHIARGPEATSREAA